MLVFRICACQDFQVLHPALEEPGIHGVPGLPGLGEIVHGVRRDEVSHVFVRRPEAKGSVFILPGPQHFLSVLEAFQGLGFRDAEVRQTVQSEHRERPADDLFRAAVRIGVEVFFQAKGHAGGKVRCAYRDLPELGMHLPVQGNFDRRPSRLPCHQLRSVRSGGTDADRLLLGRGAAARRSGECKGSGAELVLHPHFEEEGLLLPLGDRRGHLAGGRELKLPGRLHFDMHGKCIPASLHVVHDRHTDFDLVSRRCHRRDVRADDEMIAHDRARFLHADGVVGNGHRHDLQRPVEIVGYLVLDRSRSAAGRQDSGPEHHGGLVFSLERIESSIECALSFVASRRQRPLDEGVLGEDEIQDLGRADLQGALGKEVIERAGREVLRHLQNSFIHRVDNDLSRLRRAVRDPQGRTAEDLRWRFQRDPVRTGLAIDAHRHDAVAERAGVDLPGVDGPDEGDIDVCRPFHRLGHGDGLNGGGRVRGKPPVCVDLVALDRDEPRARVRGLDAHLHRVSGRVVRPVQPNLQLGVPVQCTREVARPDDRIPERRELDLVGIED